MPLIVISDTSPIRALHHLGLLPLCQQLYGRVMIPEAVRRELLQGNAKCPSIDIVSMGAFETRNPQFSPASHHIPSDLDPGESEAIALALELRADLLLIDERKGHFAAQQLGLQSIGVLGVLLEGKRRGLVPMVLPLVDQLGKGLGFFVTATLRQHLAQLAGE